MADLLNLSKDESFQLLDLRKDIIEQVILDLEKPELFDITSRVGVVIDCSASMYNLYNHGIIQSVLDRILPLALQFDDNGAFELWLFNDKYYRLGEINAENFYDFIYENDIIRKFVGGGTNYAPVMKDINEKYIVEDIQQLPNYIIFITDGNTKERDMCEKVLKDISLSPIFFQFIGIGDEDKKFLNKLDTILGRYVDNANYFELSNDDLLNISDEELYSLLLQEYPSWLELSEIQELISMQGNIVPKSLVDKKKKSIFNKIFNH